MVSRGTTRTHTEPGETVLNKIQASGLAALCSAVGSSLFLCGCWRQSLCASLGTRRHGAFETGGALSEYPASNRKYHTCHTSIRKHVLTLSADKNIDKRKWPGLEQRAIKSLRLTLIRCFFLYYCITTAKMICFCRFPCYRQKTTTASKQRCTSHYSNRRKITEGKQEIIASEMSNVCYS